MRVVQKIMKFIHINYQCFIWQVFVSSLSTKIEHFDWFPSDRKLPAYITDHSRSAGDFGF